MSYELEQVRVQDDSRSHRGTLFPMTNFATARPSPSAVCESIGLNWQAAIWLHEKGWLSFDPQSEADLTAAQEAELRFMGGLVAAGCAESLLTIMLRDLVKPYAYRIELMYFAWEDQTWHVRPGDDEQRRRFARWIDELEESASLDSLEGIRTQVEKAIREVHSWGIY